MRRLLLITLAFVVGSVTALALYLAWDYDPDRVTPVVDVPSYDSLFNAAVKKRAGKTYPQLEERRRLKVLGDLVASRESDPVREVALFHLRGLRDTAGAFGVIRKNLDNLTPDLYEVAIGSLTALANPKIRTYLDTLYTKLNADPAAHTPLGGYRTSTLVMRGEGSDVTFGFDERSRDGADYKASRAREIGLFFPARPTYFLDIPNSDDVLGRFDGSRFVTSLKESPVAEDAWALPLLDVIASLRARLGDGMLSGFFAPDRLFRDHLAIGKYEGDKYLIVSFKDKNVSVAEALVSVFETLGRDFGIKRWTVNGTTIAAVTGKATKRTLAYATVDDYFVVATDTALISRAVRTFRAERGRSLAIDPVFQRTFGAVDQSGEREFLYAWTSPSDYFDITGSEKPAARRLAIVARALGRPIMAEAGSGEAMALVGGAPTNIASTTMEGIDPMDFWRYVVNVRSLGKNAVDSLARLVKIDIGRQITPYLAPAMVLGYGGVEHMTKDYGYSNTAFDVAAAMPLRNAPPRFDTTLRRLFGGVTSLVYTEEALPGANAWLWIASDTSTNDSVLRERKLQPSFAVIGNRTLLITSIPSLLRQAVVGLGRPAPSPFTAGSYFSGRVRVDSFAVNAAQYLHAYLRRTDRYTPEEIATRIDPLRNALAMYDQVTWQFNVENGLRRGEGRLIAKSR